MSSAYLLRTERLLLRPLREDDIDIVVGYRNDPAVAALQDWDLPVSRERVAEQVARTWSDIEPGQSRQIGVERDGELIGDLYVGLDEHGGIAEIGFTLRTEYQGRGYAVEAARAVVKDLIERLGCHRIFAQLSPQNDASKRVLERLGMTLESLAPKSFWWRGRWDDNMVYAMSASSWRDRQGRVGELPRVTVVDVIPDLSVPDIEGAREFYQDYLGLSVKEFNLGWVARFTSPTTGAHLQVITRDASGPENPAISVKVRDIETAFTEAQTRGYQIVVPLRDEEWGASRFVVRAPDGTLVNIVRHHN